MERTERNEKDDAQKAKIIFISIAALVAVILIWSIASGSKARSERNDLRKEMDIVKSDNIKLEQYVKDLTQENDGLKKKIQQLEAKAKTKPAAKKKTTSKTTSKTAKKKSSKGK